MSVEHEPAHPPGADDPIRLGEIWPALKLAARSIRVETMQMRPMQRRIVWISVACLIGCLLQALVALPLMIALFGWGYSV